MIDEKASAVQARRQLTQILAAGDIEDAALTARLLVEAVTGIDPAHPSVDEKQLLQPAEISALAVLARRRLAREPLARILGEQEFYGLRFRLNEACLIPRADTETLVDAALSRLNQDKPIRILDLGTGPGTILLSLLNERPLATGFGVDLNARALDAAKTNASHLDLAPRAHWLVSRWAEAISGKFDLIISNPPYIPALECETLEPEVRDHDPRLALDGGNDGLACYRAILSDAARLLQPDGVLILELGYGQAEAVTTIAEAAGWHIVALEHDLSGIDRAIVLRPHQKA
ncbi:MAG: peptide chain release factor N(5)-glutamine methyltransferase [Alphaproteobacteria bacterium]